MVYTVSIHFKTFLPTHDASSDFAFIIFSSSSCGNKIALKPNIVPKVIETVIRTIPPATYCQMKYVQLSYTVSKSCKASFE